MPWIFDLNAMAEGHSYSFIFFYSYTLAVSLLNPLCKHMQIICKWCGFRKWQNLMALTKPSSLSLSRKVICFFNVSRAGDDFLRVIFTWHWNWWHRGVLASCSSYLSSAWKLRKHFFMYDPIWSSQLPCDVSRTGIIALLFRWEMGSEMTCQGSPCRWAMDPRLRIRALLSSALSWGLLMAGSLSLACICLNYVLPTASSEVTLLMSMISSGWPQKPKYLRKP